MRRTAKILTWSVAALITVPLLVAGVLLIAANTGPGRWLIEALAPKLTGGMIAIEGLSGRFPDAIRARRLTVADNNGVWLTGTEAALDWSPRRLVHGRVSIDELIAGSVIVSRLPTATSSSGGATGIPSLPASLSRMKIGRLEIGAAVAGRPMVLTAEGSGEIASQDTGQARLVVTALTSDDAARADRRDLDRYVFDVSMAGSGVHASLGVTEGANGLIAGFLQLPEAGPIAINASADGPRGLVVTTVAIQAGVLRSEISGTVDLTNRGGRLTFEATAPAMTVAQGVGWSSIRLNGTIHGSIDSPEAEAVIVAENLTAGGVEVASLHADIGGGMAGETVLRAGLDGIRVPGSSLDVLAGGPVTLEATTRLGDADHAARFSVTQRLFSIAGTADARRAHFRLTVADLAPLASVGGMDLRGNTALDVDASRTNGVTDLAISGDVGISGAAHPIPAVIGEAATIDLAATFRGEDVILRRFSLTGKGMSATATGQFVNCEVTADWDMRLNDTGAIRPGVSGTIAMHGHAAGSLGSLTVTCGLTGDVGLDGRPNERFSVALNVNGLPDAPAGRLTATGTVLGTPLEIAVGAERRDGGVQFVIDRAAWKSLSGGGTLDLAEGQTLPVGKLTLAMTHLADLAPIAGRPITGSITASVDATPDNTRVNATVTGGAFGGAGSIGKADLAVTITDPTGNPAIDGTLTLDRVEANGIRASGRVTGRGTMDSLALALTLTAPELHGAPAHLETSARLDATGKVLSLTSLLGSWGRETVKLAAPARIAFADNVAIDRVKLGFRQGALEMAGTWGAGSGKPGDGVLDVRVALTNFPADFMAPFGPAYAADGSISGEVRLTGSPARPSGTIRVSASGIRSRSGQGRGLPAADVSVLATLNGSNARLDGRLAVRGASLTLTGLAPLDAAGRMDLRLGGAVDLTLLNPFLSGQGQSVRGRLELALGLGGTPAAPKIGGTAHLSGGDYQDASLGTHISDITAGLSGDGETFRLDQFSGTAGPGMISASGTVRLPPGLTGVPRIELTLRASNARPLASDVVTALADADLTLRVGSATEAALSGTVQVRSAEIRVPERLPPSIAVLPVREAGSRRPGPPPASTAPDLALNLTVDAPNQVYIRGRGVDAELGGRVVLAGTTSHPLPQGGLRLRRGTFSLAGQSLNLTEGTIDFAGGGLSNPLLKLVSTSTVGAMIATVTITGGARNPKIVLSSVPDMPQDEIISQLLFKTAKSRLSPFQLAQIAAALASLSGVGPSFGDPLAGVRSALGLDQLSVGSGVRGGATLEAGRYLAPGVRIGAKQGATGGETQATVQIDIAKGLKLETTAGTTQSSATGAGGTGTSVGVTYQLEY